MKCQLHINRNYETWFSYNLVIKRCETVTREDSNIYSSISGAYDMCPFRNLNTNYPHFVNRVEQTLGPRASSDFVARTKVKRVSAIHTLTVETRIFAVLLKLLFEIPILFTQFDVVARPTNNNISCNRYFNKDSNFVLRIFQFSLYSLRSEKAKNILFENTIPTLM